MSASIPALDPLWWGVLLSCRVLPPVVLVPVFGGERVPLPARLALVVCTAIAVYPELGAFVSAPPQGLRYFGLMLKELAVGAVLALAGSCLLEAFRMGGRWIDELRGARQLSSGLVFFQNQRGTPMEELHLLLACCAFFALGGPAFFLDALRHSLDVLPLDAFPRDPHCGRAAGLLIGLSSAALRAAVSIALPVAGALLGADCLLGFVNRSAPPIPVFFLGMPLRALLGIGVVALTMDQVFGAGSMPWWL
ncbi:MAG: flagellar biosynthetic protein FliR [Deltaproteobacteria bacterium]|nr:flagellar biosynthetic protein FliR [Deltaproteobacteria bacterium]